jgi:hypothetical protein
MATRKSLTVIVGATIAATALLLVGCEGGGGGGGGGAPAPGTANVEGRVVSASDPTTGVNGAIVEVPDRSATRQATTSGATGNFALSGVPVGVLELTIRMPVTGAYHTTTVRVQTGAGATTRLTVALVPASLAQPNELFIAPRDTVMQTGVTREFNAEVRDATGTEIPVQASWALIGDILNPGEVPANHIDDDGNGVVDDGTIDTLGQYTAIKASGAARHGQIFAASGDAQDAVNVTVNPPGPPIVSQFVISPTTLRPDGGTVLISAEVEDGDGIGDRGTPPTLIAPPIPPGSIVPPYNGVADILANIQPRGSVTVTQVLVPLATGTNKLGYYETSYVIPPNSNPTLPDGTQPAQIYDVHLTAMDTVGGTTNSATLSATVEGVEAPPPAP